MKNREIILTWRDSLDISHTEPLDECFKGASEETFKELCRICTSFLENHMNYFGRKEWLINYCPYQEIVYMEHGKKIHWWSAKEYLKRKGVFQ